MAWVGLRRDWAHLLRKARFKVLVRLICPKRSIRFLHTGNVGQQLILYNQLPCGQRAVEEKEQIRIENLFFPTMPSSGMLRSAALVRTDISEECIASLIRVA
jgi:hypothetical protein